MAKLHNKVIRVLRRRFGDVRDAPAEADVKAM